MIQESHPPRFKAYSDEYKEACFMSWYKAGCPNSMETTLKIMPPNPDGIQPRRSTILSWREEMGWAQRADLYNARAAQELETEMVESRKAMLRKHAEEGSKLQDLGMKYLEGTTGIENDSTALRAVLEGAVLERTSLGLSEALTRIMKMSDDQLVNEVQNILKNARTDKIIDMGEVEEEDIETVETSDGNEQVE